MSNIKTNVPTEELKLDNNEVVVFYKYLTTGESRELQKAMLKSGKFNIESGKMESLSMETFFDIQDTAASFAIKEVKSPDGKASPFSQEWLSALPVEMGNKIYEKINEITQVSQLKPDVKKN